MKRALLIAIAFGLLALAAAPTADARPQCIQVYPWSYLCQHGAVAFYCWYFSPEGVLAAPCQL